MAGEISQGIARPSRREIRALLALSQRPYLALLDARATRNNKGNARHQKWHGTCGFLPMYYYYIDSDAITTIYGIRRGYLA